MRFEKVTVTSHGEAAELALYLLDDVVPELPARKRPTVIICPGGGYAYTSPREAEPVAMRFLAMGCNAAVLYYSCEPARYPVALCQLALSVAHIRRHAEDFHADTDKIVICGFSAGGHLAASLGVKWQLPFMKAITGCDSLEYRPNALILGYPVITSGEFAHRGSFDNLLGAGATENMLAQQSLETLVTPAMPPVFMWQTWEDETVPVQNSLLFAEALRAANISLEYHIFPHGIHGLSLANEETANAVGAGVQAECECWIDLAHGWLCRTMDIK